MSADPCATAAPVTVDYPRVVLWSPTETVELLRLGPHEARDLADRLKEAAHGIDGA